MKTVLVTGATSGIGLAVCRAMAAKGWRILACGRTEEHCAGAKERILNETPGADVTYFCGDLMHQREVRRLTAEIAAHLEARCDGRLDALISNAGGVRSWYATTEEGYEQQFALNYLAGFLLVHGMLPYLKDGARVILTGSGSHKHMNIRWNDLMLQRRYSCLMAYKQSKLCAMLFAREWNRRFSHRGVRAYVADPGLVNTEIGCKRTGGLVSRFWSLRRKHGAPPERAAETYVWLCQQEAHPEGLYFGNCRAQKGSRQSENAADAGRLYQISEKLCGIDEKEALL